MNVNQVTGNPLVRKVLVGIAAAAAIVAVVGFLVLPPIVRSVLEKQATKALHRTTTVKEVRINPFLLTVSVRGLVVADREGAEPLLGFQELFVDAQLASAWHRGPVLREIRLRAPYARLVRNADGSYNITDLIDEFTKKPSPPDAKPLRFSLNNIRIQGGRVDFDDRPKKTRHAVRNVTLAVPFVSNLPYYVETYVEPAFSADVNGTPVALAGKTRPFAEGRETSFALDVHDFDIPYYLEYAPAPLAFRVPSGTIDAKLTLFFTQRKSAPPEFVLSGEAALKKLRVAGPDDAPVLSVPRLDIPLVSAKTGPLRIKLGDVRLSSPELHLARGRDGKLTLLSLLPGGKPSGKAEADAGKAANAGGEEKKKEPAVQVEATALRLAGGKIFWLDAAVDGKPFRTSIDNLTVVAHDFTNAPGRPFRLEAALSTESGETVRHDGNLTLAPLEAAGEVAVGRVALGKYAPYYGKAVRFDVREGKLDLSTRYAYRGGDNAVTAIDNLAAALSSLRLRQRGADSDFLRLPRFEVKDTSVDLLRRTVRIGEIGGARGQLRVTRDKAGAVNLAGLGPPPPASAPPSVPASPRKAETPSDRPWRIEVGRLALERYSVAWDDQQPDEAVLLTLSPVDVRATALSTERNARGKASVRLTMNGKGTASVGGSVGIDPTSADLSVQLDGIDLVALQPYFTGKLAVELTGGRFDADGKLSLALPAGAPARVRWEGEAAVRGLASIDKENAEDFLKWESLRLAGMRVGVNPTTVAIREVALTDLFSRLVVHEDGSLNVQGIVRKETSAADNAAAAQPAAAPAPPTASAAAGSGAPTPVTVETVTMQGGTILFTDRHVRPNYTAKLEEVGGRVSGLSSEETKMADVLLRGRLDNHAPLEIAGRINPLRNDLFVDLKVDFKDIDLSPMTPYSGRYAGYSIEKGKLSLGLTYLIARKKLDAGNQVFIDQFNFGEKVDSPDATKLPVRLAVSLLKDRNGEIRLDLPVTGDLDDPKFSVWGVIWQVVKNLLVKAATSPFALLGALAGNGEELSYLEFPPGQAIPDPAGEGKLRTLAKAMGERPALKLDVVGHADPPADRDALRTAAFDRKIRAQKLKDVAKTGEKASLDNVVVAPEEYPKYLLKAYSAETFPKPRNVIGMQKELPVPEMEKLMLTHIAVTDDDLRQLAQARARRAVDFLVATKQVEADRVFLVEAKSLAPEKKEKVRDSRVEFVLK